MSGAPHRQTARTTPLRACAFAAAALLFGFVALWAVWNLFFNAAVSQMDRIRAAAAVGSIAVGGATFECIRRTQLRERYALLWMFPCLAILLLAFFPRVLDAVQKPFGLSYGTIVAAVAFLALVFAMFVFSLAISRLEAKLSQCAQSVALLEARLHDRDRGKPDNAG